MLVISSLKTRAPFIYLERGSLKTKGKALIFENSTGVFDIPGDKFACLLLGPGTTVSHESIKQAADQKTLLQWVGEHGSAIYSAGEPLAGDCDRIRNQALAALSPKARPKVVRWMFQRRFGTCPAAHLSEDQIRGMEGARIKAVYQELSKKWGVPWSGRTTGAGSDDINRVISIANGIMTQAATVSVLAAGFSPAVGFLHTGFAKAFSCDIADLHKFQVSVPLAFQLCAAGKFDYADVRRGMRDLIVQQNLIDQMIRDAIEAVDAGIRRP
jgi:CRISPR-associated protein Cas1